MFSMNISLEIILIVIGIIFNAGILWQSFRSLKKDVDELKDDVKSLRIEMKEDMSTLRSELKDDIRETNRKIDMILYPMLYREMPRKEERPFKRPSPRENDKPPKTKA